MAHLPPVGWADVATKRDLDHFATVLEAKLDAGLAGVRTELHEEVGGLHEEVGGLRTELRTGLADVRTELAQEVGGLRTELRTGLADVRTELRTGLADVRTELHKEIGSLHQALGAQTRNLFLGLVGLQISGVTSAVVLSRVL